MKEKGIKDGMGWGDGVDKMGKEDTGKVRKVVAQFGSSCTCYLIDQRKQNQLPMEAAAKDG
jgi:hypothetical protein